MNVFVYNSFKSKNIETHNKFWINVKHHIFSVNLTFESGYDFGLALTGGGNYNQIVLPPGAPPKEVDDLTKKYIEHIKNDPYVERSIDIELYDINEKLIYRTTILCLSYSNTRYESF